MITDLLEERVFQQFILIISGFVALVILIYIIFRYYLSVQAKRSLRSQEEERDEKPDDAETKTSSKEAEIKSVLEASLLETLESETAEMEKKIEVKTPVKEELPSGDIEIDGDLDREVYEKVKESDEKVIDVNAKEEPEPEANDEDDQELGKYHVMYRKEDKKWYIKREGSTRIIRVLETQKEAIAYATIKAINQDTSIVIHKMDGKIRKQSY